MIRALAMVQPLNAKVLDSAKNPLERDFTRAAGESLPVAELAKSSDAT